MISQLFPGDAPDKSYTNQIFLMEKEPVTDMAKREAKDQFKFLEYVVAEEDYATGIALQKNLQSGTKSPCSHTPWAPIEHKFWEAFSEARPNAPTCVRLLRYLAFWDELTHERPSSRRVLLPVRSWLALPRGVLIGAWILEA